MKTNNTINTELNREMKENTSGNSRARLAVIAGAVLALTIGGTGVAYASSDNAEMSSDMATTAVVQTPSESWPTESWPTESWPEESWPEYQAQQSWPTESWPTESWPEESWPEILARGVLARVSSATVLAH